MNLFYNDNVQKESIIKESLEPRHAEMVWHMNCKNRFKQVVNDHNDTKYDDRVKPKKSKEIARRKERRQTAKNIADFLREDPDCVEYV